MNGFTRSHDRAGRRGPLLMAAFLLLLTASSGLTAGTSVNSDKSIAPRKFVVFGASYAGSWGAPPLPGYVIVNRGVGGEQTKNMRARFQRDVVKERPDVVLIWGHINNITQSDVVGSTPERIAAVKNAAREDYLAMLKQARGAGIEVMLATELPLAESSGLMNGARALLGQLLGKQSYAEMVNAEVRDLNEFVRQLAARERLRLLDFEKVLAPDGGARESKYATEDLSHVTAAGYQALTAYAIEELGKRR